MTERCALTAGVERYDRELCFNSMAVERYDREL